MKNIKLTLEYDGTHFCGWQRQTGRRTVEGVLNQTLSKVLGGDIAVIGSGRTDARVHALGQVANFKTASPVPVEKIPRAVNAYLPADVAILSAEEVPPGFHARYGQKRKTYLYKIHSGRVESPLLRNRAHHEYRPLDEDAMRAALAPLMGPHDFRGFMSAGSQVENTVRTLYRGEISREKALLLIELEGNGFLYNMVRRIVGVLIEIGCGEKPIRETQAILDTGDAHRSRRLADPQGLYLKSVLYQD